jgi:hypothetical protein
MYINMFLYVRRMIASSVNAKEIPNAVIPEATTPWSIARKVVTRANPKVSRNLRLGQDLPQ